MAPVEKTLTGIAGAWLFLALLLVVGGELSGTLRPAIELLVWGTFASLLGSQVVKVRKLVGRPRR